MDPGKPHLLVVDDEPLNRTLLQRLLEGDYNISLSEDADEAMQLLDSELGGSVRLVLCDHLMPGRTGVELAREARANHPGLPFLLLTGCDQESEVLEAKANGIIAAVLPKPWRTQQLRELILKFLV